MDIPFIPFTMDKTKLSGELEKYSELLAQLTFAERIIWAVTSVKKASSFDFQQDIVEGRCLEQDVLTMLSELGLSFNPPTQCYPEPSISQINWNIDESKASMDLPYRERDAELARWFDYPSCCVKGYRTFFDQNLDFLLENNPFKNMKSVLELDAYIYPENKKDNSRFKEAGEYIKKIRLANPWMVSSRGLLTQPIREEMKKTYDDSSYHLLLHFCLPIHDWNCPNFKQQTQQMYGVLKDLISEDYAELVVKRTIAMDDQNVCF